MPAVMKNPAKRSNADGVVNAVIPIQGNYPMSLSPRASSKQTQSRTGLNYQELRDGGQSVSKGLSHIGSILHAIKLASRDASERTDPCESLVHIETLADLGAEQALVQADTISDLNDLVDELDKPTVDMMKSGLQADSIQQSLAALLQVIPEDQTDTIGSLKTTLKLAHDLSIHLASGGRYRLVLKEALEESDGIANRSANHD